MGDEGMDRLANPPNDRIAELLGIDLSPERLAQDLAVFRDIQAEIAKLRELDLTDVHPVVVFDARAAFARR
jgi:hypothetical protein